MLEANAALIAVHAEGAAIFPAVEQNYELVQCLQRAMPQDARHVCGGGFPTCGEKIAMKLDALLDESLGT